MVVSGGKPQAMSSRRPLSPLSFRTSWSIRTCRPASVIGGTRPPQQPGNRCDAIEANNSA